MKNRSILFIANSFGDDTTYFMPYMAKNVDTNLQISNLYIGGCEVTKHINNLKENNNAYEYRHFNSDKNIWENTPNTSIREALHERKWDIIVIQEASHVSGVEGSYKLVDELIDLVEKEIDYKPEIYWNMTWSYSSNTGHPAFASNYMSSQKYMFDGIVKNVNHLKENQRIKDIIPNGYYVQIAKDIFGDEKMHLPDGFHMSQPLGRYLVALGAMKTLLNVDVKKITFIPENLDKCDSLKCIDIVFSN